MEPGHLVRLWTEQYSMSISESVLSTKIKAKLKVLVKNSKISRCYNSDLLSIRIRKSQVVRGHLRSGLSELSGLGIEAEEPRPVIP